MIIDFFLLALKNIQKRRLRSWLTMIGIIVSIATVFTLFSISLGLQGAVSEQFRLLGTDKFFIMPKGQLGAPGTGGAVQLTTLDANIVEKTPGVKQLTYFTAANAEVKANNQVRYYQVFGLPLDKLGLYEETSSIKIDEGRFLKSGDSKKIMIGSDYKYRNIFKKPLHAGDKITINGIDFKVEGILASIGNPSDDQNIIMSLEDVREVGNITDRIDQMVIQVDAGEDVNKVADSVKRKLLIHRGVTEKTIDFTISTPEELLSSFGNILDILTVFLVGIAAISLLVGAIGIANTMYTSVLERTKEIGIMKSIGAQNKDILLLFLFEAGLLGTIGGIFGVCLGFFTSKGIEFIAVQQLGTNLLRAAFPLYLIIGCLLFAFITGAVSGLWPAWRATKIEPVVALRYE
jgi:putative ABC transport system permease protein